MSTTYLVKWKTEPGEKGEESDEAIMTLEDIAHSPKESFRAMLPLVARKFFRHLEFSWGFIEIEVTLLKE